MMRFLLCISIAALGSVQHGAAQQPFALEQVLSAPFPANLTASKTGERLAWTLDEQGRRNIWVAEGPSFAARRLTAYNEDDGGELSQLQFTPDGAAIVYVRGEGKNGSGQYANPTSNPSGAEQTVWMISWSGGEPSRIDAGNSPCLSAQGKVASARDAAERYYSEPDRATVWAIWVADAETGAAREIWHSGNALQSSYPEMAKD